ncbi:MAG: ribbon-helix-helix protein, CopG family [Fusobacteriaceae bacterium]
MAVVRKRISVNLDPKTIELLKKLSADSYLSQSRLIEQLIWEKQKGKQ